VIDRKQGKLARWTKNYFQNAISAPSL
jgi:hypothetical protein